MERDSQNLFKPGSPWKIRERVIDRGGKDGDRKKDKIGYKQGERGIEQTVNICMQEELLLF